MTPEGLTAPFRQPELPPLHGSLAQLFDLMEAVASLGAAVPATEDRRPIEGTFLL